MQKYKFSRLFAKSQFWTFLCLCLAVGLFSAPAFTQVSPAPSLNYRFDECRYTGTNGDVIDQTGSYNGSTNGISSSLDDAVIGNSLDLTASDTSDWVSVPRSVVDGLNDFSVSVWVKTSVNKSQQAIFQALGSSTGDDELEIFLKNNNTVYVKIRDVSQDFPSSIITTDNNWHHIVVTRARKKVHLYVDGQLQSFTNGANNGQLSVTNNNAVVIGQEQDSFGGSFSSTQSFEGQLDEFKIYPLQLSAAQVDNIYQNELAGNNFDSSTRQNQNCSSLVAEFRFDELSYSDVENEVIDSFGGLNGRAKGAKTVQGKICSALDLSPTGTNNYVVLDEAALNGKTKFSVSVWAKTTKTGNQSILSGAGSNSANELIMWFTNSTRFSPHLNGKNNGNITGLSFADNNWHHLVWTYDGTQSCIYQDKIKIGCVNQPPGSLNIQSLIIGQEQDNIGGRFSSSQAYDGLLDELLIYQHDLNQSEVSDLFDKQDAGLNLDGSARFCPLPLVYYEFEEESWANVGDVLDSSQNANHGSPIGASIPLLDQTTQKSCQVLDIPKNTSSTEFDAVDTGYDINDLGNKGTISFWYKSDENWNSGEHRYLFDASKVGARTSESKYFFLTIHNNSSLLFGVQDDSGGQIQVYTDGYNFIANEWVHIAATWDLSTNSYSLLVNGQVQRLYTSGNSMTSATLGDVDSLYIGDNRSPFWSYGNSANGQFDNFRLFNFVQSQSAIQTDMQDVNTCNYSPIAEYRFDEISYSDVENEIIENIGGLNGRAKSAQTVEGKICNALDLSESGTGNYAILDAGILTGKTEFSVSVWAKTTKTGTQSILSGAGPDGANEFIMWFTNSNRFLPYLNDRSNGTVSGLSFADNDWHHLVWTYDGSQSCIYQDKVKIGCVTQPPGQLNIQSLIMGQEQDSVGGRFSSGQAYDGLLDELLIYEQALSPSQVALLYDNQSAGLNHDGTIRDNATCVAVDHYRIEHDTKGFTCEAETITIKACLNESCDVLYDQQTSIKLSPSGWSGGDNLVFTGQLTTKLSVTEQSTITFSKGAASAEAPLRCFNGNDETCEMQFVNDGFEFYDANGGPNLPDQVAASNFTNLNLRAVRNDAGVCKALLAGEQDITLIYDCDTPNVCLTPFAGVPILGDGSGESSGTVSLTFDSEGVASLSSLSYADAGRIKIKAQANIDNTTVTATTDGEPLDIYPSYLALGVAQTTLNYGGSANENNFLAGDNFTLVVGAYGTNDELLPNYQSENPQLKVVRIAPSASGVDGTLRYSDTGNKTSAVAAVFENTTSLPFSGGEYRYLAAYYSEVGRIEVDLKDSSYLGNEISSNGALTLGNFYPAYFNVALSQQPALADTCGAFSYLGQEIEFATEPKLTITAYSALDTVTNNYSASTNANDNFWNYLPDQAKLNSTLSYIDGSDYSTTGSASVINLGDSPLIENNTSFNGTGTIAITNGSFKYDKVDSASGNLAYAKVSPFAANLDLVFNSNFFNQTFTGQAGSQSICFKDNYASASCNELTIEDVQGTEVRYGRLVLQSTFGPETESLNVPIKTEFFAAGQWRLNTDDHCTSIAFTQAANQIKLTPIDGYDTDLVGEVKSEGQLIMGLPVDEQLTLDAPCDGDGQCFQGQLQLSLDPSAAGIEWPSHLNYDWNGDGNIDTADFPKSIISFGQFRSNDRIIQWREVFN